MAVLLLLAGCASGGGEDYGGGCDFPRAQAKAAAEEGERLRERIAADPSAAVDETRAPALAEEVRAGARAYVAIVLGRPECFSAEQRADAEKLRSEVQPLQK